MNELFSSAHRLSTALQGKSVDLASSVEMADDLSNLLKQTRTNANPKFPELFRFAEDLAKSAKDEKIGEGNGEGREESINSSFWKTSAASSELQHNRPTGILQVVCFFALLRSIHCTARIQFYATQESLVESPGRYS